MVGMSACMHAVLAILTIKLNASHSLCSF